MLNQKICREHASKCIESSEPLLNLFQQWLIAFEKTQSATRDEEPVAAVSLSGSSRASQRLRPRGCVESW